MLFEAVQSGWSLETTARLMHASLPFNLKDWFRFKKVLVYWSRDNKHVCWCLRMKRFVVWMWSECAVPHPSAIFERSSRIGNRFSFQVQFLPNKAEVLFITPCSISLSGVHTSSTQLPRRRHGHCCHLSLQSFLSQAEQMVWFTLSFLVLSSFFYVTLCGSIV